MSNIKLKPCPFCGGEAKLQGITVVWIKCKQCGVSTWGFKEEKRAIDLWNSRKPEAEEEETE